VLDVACGRGRHARYFAARGCTVTAVDRDREALAAMAGIPGIETVAADLEGGAPWPLRVDAPGAAPAPRPFDAVIVTNYLHRALFPVLADSVRAGGVLLYETFMLGNEAYGRPSNPAFLPRPGELLEAFGGQLAAVAFEQGLVRRATPAVVQRLCAMRGAPAAVPLIARDEVRID
jgi:SAM-dependent methyltransferase